MPDSNEQGPYCVSDQEAEHEVIRRHYKTAQLADKNGLSSTVEHSLSLGLAAGLDLSKVFSAGLEAGYSVS